MCFPCLILGIHCLAQEDLQSLHCVGFRDKDGALWSACLLVGRQGFQALGADSQDTFVRGRVRVQPCALHLGLLLCLAASVSGKDPRVRTGASVPNPVRQGSFQPFPFCAYKFLLGPREAWLPLPSALLAVGSVREFSPSARLLTASSGFSVGVSPPAPGILRTPALAPPPSLPRTWAPLPPCQEGSGGKMGREEPLLIFRWFFLPRISGFLAAGAALKQLLVAARDVESLRPCLMAVLADPAPALRRLARPHAGSRSLPCVRGRDPRRRRSPQG